MNESFAYKVIGAFDRGAKQNQSFEESRKYMSYCAIKTEKSSRKLVHSKDDSREV